MIYIRSSLLPNSTQHHKLGVPVVAGISLSPVSPQAFNWCHSIGGNPVILSASDATAELVEVVEAARKTYADNNADLANAIASASDSIKEAKGLARLPVVGDEADTIKNMAFLVERRAASPEPDDINTSNVSALARNVGGIYGLDDGRIRDSLAAYDIERTRRVDLLGKLRGAAEELNGLADKASLPVTREQVAKIKADAKSLRVMPVVLGNLHQLRAEFIEITKRLDETIKNMEESAV